MTMINLSKATTQALDIFDTAWLRLLWVNISISIGHKWKRVYKASPRADQIGWNVFLYFINSSVYKWEIQDLSQTQQM